jgi:hypothetical protein
MQHLHARRDFAVHADPTISAERAKRAVPGRGELLDA